MAMNRALVRAHANPSVGQFCPRCAELHLGQVHSARHLTNSSQHFSYRGCFEPDAVASDGTRWIGNVAWRECHARATQQGLQVCVRCVMAAPCLCDLSARPWTWVGELLVCSQPHRRLSSSIRSTTDMTVWRTRIASSATPQTLATGSVLTLPDAQPYLGRATRFSEGGMCRLCIRCVRSLWKSPSTCWRGTPSQLERARCGRLTRKHPCCTSTQSGTSPH